MRVLLDATALAGGHGQRGIGAYVRGLIAGFRELDAADRPELLLPDGEPERDGFSSRRVHLPRWRVPRVPDPLPQILGARAAARGAWEVVHATRLELLPRHPGLVVTLQDVIPLRFRERYLDGVGRAPERRAYLRALDRVRTARIVIVPTRAVAEDVASLAGVDPRRVRVVPHAPLPRASPHGEVPAAPFLLFSGGVEPHKNVGLAVRALALVPPPVRLVVTGPTSARRAQRVVRKAEALGVADRLDLLGQVDPGRLAALRDAAAAVLVPSLAEGFGFPLLEAQEAGRPAIASDIPVLREVGGRAARYLPPHDPEPWAAEIGRILTAGRPEYAALGPGHAASFSWRRTAEATRACYLEAAP